MKINRGLLIAQVVGLFVVFALLLFGAAGTTSWWAGWWFLILFFGFVTAISLWLLGYNPALLQERMTGLKSAEKGWDVAILLAMNAAFLFWLILMPLDAVRFRWSNVPLVLQLVGEGIMLASFVLFYLTFRANSYLSPVVRIQGERGQTVVSTGPYAYVRHPMYAAALLLFVGTSLMLGSWYGVLVGLLLEAGIARRAVLEEQTLREELQGYEEYQERVRYRLIPHVW